MTVPVGLSTSSVFPEDTAHAFEQAARLGYDGVEVMVTADRLSQDAARLGALAADHGVPVLSVHSPCLVLSGRVWGTDPFGKLQRSVELAIALGAGVVVAHPPFRWQRGAADFPEKVAGLAAELALETAASAGAPGSPRIAIENMYPAQVLGRTVSVYRPGWDVVATGYPGYTLDLSHTAVAHVDAVELAAAMGDRLAHVHLGDGSGAAYDEHLVPGRGRARCAEVLHSVPAKVAAGTLTGAVIVEVSTRTRTDEQRAADLTEALAFARTHLGRP